MKRLLIFLLLLPILSFSQANPFEVFENLLGKKWVANGQWGDGSAFKQEIEFRYNLDKSIIETNSWGFTNQEQTEFGLRNKGIRAVDPASGKLKFWEFDVFGGTTYGTIEIEDKNIRYQYKYGETVVTDFWEYIDDFTYNFKVGNYEDETWKQVYLETQFKAKTATGKTLAFKRLKERLAGEWSSKAWDGNLHESWRIDQDGNLLQNAQYMEDGKIVYEATNKLEMVENDLILFSVIKDSNPKIFRATGWTDRQVLFENSEYKNPSKVLYDLKDEKSFTRTISGTEQGEPTTYTFNFERKE